MPAAPLQHGCAARAAAALVFLLAALVAARI